MSDDDGLRMNPSIDWITEDDLRKVGDRADRQLDEYRQTLGWADRSLADLAARLAERARKAGR